MENAEVKKNLQIGQDVIQNEIDEIDIIVKHYANWSALHEFMETHDRAFITENLGENVQKNLDINLVLLVDTQGQIIFSKSLDFQDNKTYPVQFDVAALFKKYPELVVRNENHMDGLKGLISLDGKIILTSSHPILTSQFSGTASGVLLFGRFLDAGEDQKLSQTAHFDLFTHNLAIPISTSELGLAKYALTSDAALPEDLPPSQCRLCHPIVRGSSSPALTNQPFISPVNDQLMGGYTLLQDIHQNPAAILAIHTSREIEQLESRNSFLFLLPFLSLMIVAGVLSLNIIARYIKTEETRDLEYKLLRAVIDNVPEQIYAHDVNGRFLLNNQCDAKMMGVDNPEELRGKSDFDYYPPELAAEFQASEKQVILTGQAIEDSEGVLTTNGKQRWILTTKTPLRDNLGQIRGIVGVSRDITVRKQRERELEAIVMISHSLRSAETSTELLSMIYNRMIDLLHADFGALELIDPATGDANVLYSHGLENPSQGRRTPVTMGLNRYIRDSKKAYLDNHLSENPLALNELLDSGCKAIAGAPMIAVDELIGFLWIGRKSEISEAEVSLLGAIADIAANSIRRVTLFELTEKRMKQLLSLRKIDTSINNSKELGVTLGILLEQTRSQLQVDAADMLFCSPDLEFLEFQFGLGFNTKSFGQTKFRMNEGPAGMAAQTKELVHIRNIAELGAAHPLVIGSQAEGFVSYFAVPLLIRTEIKGVLEVFLRREFIPDADWINFLETLAGQAAIAIEQVQLYEGLQHSNQELVQAYDETIQGWVRALDLRDKETEGHSLRVAQLCTELAVALGIAGDELIHLRRGALLHDIGKVGIPDHILLKPGQLTEQEWGIMRGHPQLAYEMLSPIDYLHPALAIPYCHHEKWDGSGYPRGLAGAEIPFEARIFALVDVWDALCSDRPYRAAWPKERSRKYILEQSGKHFDPQVVQAFLEMLGTDAI